MSEPLRISPSEDLLTPVRLRSGAVLQVRRPPLVADREIAWRMRRPGWYATTEAVDRLLARCVEPAASASAMRGLDAVDRRRLMLTVVRLRHCEADWHRLYGSALSLDERFFSVMAWAQRREADRLRARLVETRQKIGRDSRAPLEQMEKKIGTSLADRFGKQGAGAAILDQLMPTQRLNPLARAAMGLETPAIGRAFRGSTALEQLVTGQLDNPLAKAALALQQPSANKALNLGIRSQLDYKGIDPSRGIGAMLAGKINANYSEWFTFPAASTVLGIGRDRADLLQQSAIDAFRRAYGLGNGSQIGAALGMRMDRFAAKPGSAAFGGDIQRIAMIPAMPLFDGRLRLLMEQGGIGSLLTSMGIGADLLKGRLSGALDQFARVQEAVEVAARFVEAWSDDPLWFLLSILTPRESRWLAEMKQEQVYGVIFDALEDAVCRSELVDAVLVALPEISFLTSEQREWLAHGLEHAKAGDWTQAVPPLITGFEGGLHGAAVQAEAIDGSPEGHFMGPEKLIKKIEFDRDFEQFAVRLAFSDWGQPFRHGRPRSRARDQTLILVVAVVGWIDHTLGYHGTYHLASEMREPLTLAARNYEDQRLIAA